MASNKPPTKDCLGKRDLATVQNYLVQVRHKWFDIGVQLNLDPEDLQKLMINGKLSDNDRLRNMCLDWLLGQEPVPSWRGLCAALRMPAVNEARLASVVEKERIFVDLEMSGVTPGLVLADALSGDMSLPPPPPQPAEKSVAITEQQSTNGNLTPPTPKQQDKQVNGSISQTEPEQESIGGGAEGVVQNPFPYLITSGLSQEERDGLMERLVLECANVRLKFCSLTCNFLLSLLSRNVSLSQVSDEVQKFLPFYYDQVFKYRATDVAMAVSLLTNSSNFQFHAIFNHLIDKIGSLDDKDEYQEYSKLLGDFSKRRLFECPDGIFGGSRWDQEDELVVKKRIKGKSIHDVMLEDVSRYVSEFRAEFKVDEFNMRLLSISMEGSHLVLYFALDKGLVNSEACFPLAQERRERLMEVGVWHVSCGEFIFEQRPQEDMEDGDGHEEDVEEQPYHILSMEASTKTDPDIATLGLRECMSYEDEDIGSYTALACDNTRHVIEVSSNSEDTPYKSYKIGQFKRGKLEWVSGMKGIRYGIGKAPKIALNNEGYVVEVDEEDDGKISFRVGIIHPSNVMLWTEATPTGLSGSQPCVVVFQRTVVMAYTRKDDAYYASGMLNTGQRTVQWATVEHKFLLGNIRDLAIAINSNLEVGVVYAKSSMSSRVNPLYFIAGKLKGNKITFSSNATSSQNFAPTGWFPSMGMKPDGSILVVYSQYKSVPYKKIKFRIGKVEKTSKGSGLKVKWDVNPEDCFEFTGKQAAMVMNDKGSVVISYALNHRYSCHTGKLFQETSL